MFFWTFYVFGSQHLQTVINRIVPDDDSWYALNLITKWKIRRALYYRSICRSSRHLFVLVYSWSVQYFIACKKWSTLPAYVHFVLRVSDLNKHPFCLLIFVCCYLISECWQATFFQIPNISFWLLLGVMPFGLHNTVLCPGSFWTHRFIKDNCILASINYRVWVRFCRSPMV